MNNLDAAVLNSFPPVDESMLDDLLGKEIKANHQKIVVLDDDPTGVQTVHDVSVYTDWTVESIREGFAEENKVFYILTNSRGMTEQETTAAHRRIAERVAAVSAETGIPYIYMSRSDSTLRGHYPLETKLLREGVEAAGGRIDGEILCPFFKEGGRFTIGNIHYVRQGEELVPAADTEFAFPSSRGSERGILRSHYPRPCLSKSYNQISAIYSPHFYSHQLYHV